MKKKINQEAMKSLLTKRIEAEKIKMKIYLKSVVDMQNQTRKQQEPLLMQELK